jgi:hypothetical protein
MGLIENEEVVQADPWSYSGPKIPMLRRIRPLSVRQVIVRFLSRTGNA